MSTKTKLLKAYDQALAVARRANTGFSDPEIARHYEAFKREGSFGSAVLGSSIYEKTFRMPKWNVPVTILREPKVALRHAGFMEISSQPEYHEMSANHFEQLHTRFAREYVRMIEAALKRYGQHGSLISGVVRDHFPGVVKGRLRFLAHGAPKLKDAARFHTWYANRLHRRHRSR